MTTYQNGPQIIWELLAKHGWLDYSSSKDNEISSKDLCNFERFLEKAEFLEDLESCCESIANLYQERDNPQTIIGRTFSSAIVGDPPYTPQPPYPRFPPTAIPIAR